ncbi:MAG: bifunctional (p)ppGpp synthetase/guanosine-3',5'-bis(diphosphate) 3'-pyrophosphohydrolase [Pseudobutyrivibrio sp.]|nr:bifunctional (p)ppGpp synthetase/guanosine-3',5'-bis(diphosphate) 3'-pyrophosphohydrolase [Pseudobutyrivibrio sp.]
MDINNKELEKLEIDIAKENRGVISTTDFVDPDELYKELITRVRKYHPNDDISMIEKAYQIASNAHQGQLRKSGEPYIIHPLCVAIILADLELDKETIVAGLLHDVVEDTVLTKEQIAEEFSEEVAELVDGVTKLGQLNYDADKVEIQAENLRKMFLAMAKDIRVILIKLADRLHNMRTLKYMREDKQKEKARETMEIYAPLAQRLGISKVKIELDDLSLKYIEPTAYYDLVEKIALRKDQRAEYVQSLVDDVKKHIEAADIQAEVYGRAKHFFSIYKKMVNQHKTIDQIYDLFAVRIIVDSIKDCYAALGVIHEMYTPIPGRFKDYIAMPKPNMYQSLHTTVIGPNGAPFEIQIRTYEMHRTSEYGIAAHWKYKESGEGSTVMGEEEKLSWLREILEWQQEISDNKEFSSLLKSDLNLFSDTVFCFTPTGDVKNLPNGSTPIDFAYAIHSAVGNRMIGAKVNGKLVPIDYQIQNGDRIEVITSQNTTGPSRDWLNIVKSSQAKNKINQWFRTQSKEENIAKGKELVISSAKQKGVDLGEINKPKYQELIKNKYGFHSWEDCLAAVGQGAIKEGAVINRMYSAWLKDHPIKVTDEDVLEEHSGKDSKEKQRSKNGITVSGLYDVSVRFSKCCNPVPGDEIVGFVTRGRGVSVHRTDCINIINLPDFEKERLIEAEWAPEALAEGGKNGAYLTEINIYGNNRTGLLVDITRIFTEREIDIDSINSKTSKQGVATITIKFGTQSKEQLRSLVERIKQVESIIDVERPRG